MKSVDPCNIVLPGLLAQKLSLLVSLLDIMQFFVFTLHLLIYLFIFPFFSLVPNLLGFELYDIL